jgi:site-specific DNA-cytosine methylase
MMTVLSLCDFTGNWSRPYEERGYDVVRVDLKHGQDVRLFEIPPYPVRGILAAPPCTDFASSGARWWEGKGEGCLLESLSIVDACLRLVAVLNPVWWALENPVGRLKRWIGEPTMAFDPADYGGYSDGDAYTKRTLLWGRFNQPLMRKVEATEGSKMHKLPPSEDRQALRSETPMGFARAFCESNP